MNRFKAAAAGITLILMVALTVIVLTKDSVSDTEQTVDKLVIRTEEEQEEPENSLKKNQYPEINQLVHSYYEMVASGDLEGLQTITSDFGEHFQEEVENNQKFVEEYRNIDVYTKHAEAENAYIAFVYYEMKIRDIETPVPGLGNLYVTRGEDGQYIVANGIYDSKAQEYVQQVASDEDVQALVKEVQQKYRSAKESDETLRLALDDLRTTYSE